MSRNFRSPTYAAPETGLGAMAPGGRAAGMAPPQSQALVPGGKQPHPSAVMSSPKMGLPQAVPTMPAGPAPVGVAPPPSTRSPMPVTAPAAPQGGTAAQAAMGFVRPGVR